MSTTFCQSCLGPDLTQVFFAGWLPPVNTFQPVEASHLPEDRYPAELLQCNSCGLVQMAYAPKPSTVFPRSYSYRSGTTRILRENFANLAEEVGQFVGGINAEDLILDIASNDGTLLKEFRDRYGCRVQGVEPTDARLDAEKEGIPTLPRFWNMQAVDEIVRWRGKARIVTACNVFAHVPDPRGFLRAVDKILDTAGVLVLEVHYLPDLLRGLQYDTIYHEHLRYYSLTNLRPLLADHNLYPVFVRQIPTHGGSLRIYAKRGGEHDFPSAIQPPGVSELLEHEKYMPAWETFRSQVAWSKNSLWRMLEVMKRSDSKIYGVGCPSRAVTLIHYCGMDHNILDCVCEVSGSPKIGHYVPGTIIPVVDEERLIADQPDFALILSWHIATDIACKLRVRGYKGRFLVPLPEPKILEGV